MVNTSGLNGALHQSIEERNEYYRQEADFQQIAGPLYLTIADVDWERLTAFVCEEYRCRAAQQIRYGWEESGGKYRGRMIDKYPENELQLTLNALCTAGSDSDSLTKRFGGDSLVRYRAYKRTAQPTRIFGAERCRYLVDTSRRELREQWLAQYEAGKELAATPRLYLADRLKHSSGIAQLDLQKAVEYQAKQRQWVPKATRARPATLGEYMNYLTGQPSWTPHELGQLLGSIDYFQRCWQDFREAEQLPVDIKQPVIPEVASGFGMADRWDGLLQNYSVADLDKLLVYAGLLESAEPRIVMLEIKSRHWVAIVAALEKARKTNADRAALHRAFLETYGHTVGSLSAFSRQGYNEGNEAARVCYSRAISHLT